MILQPLPVGLFSWIIQDGNYADFRVGETRAFALEFYAAQPLARTQRQDRSLQIRGDAQFSVVATSLYRAEDWWALDFGTLAYSDRPAPVDHKAGDMFQGDIYLGVDPFFYFEDLSKRPDSPPLIFDWRIVRIEMQTAPFIERDGMQVRDPDKIGWREIDRTNAWSDDNGSAEYILHCTCLNDKPRRTLRP